MFPELNVALPLMWPRANNDALWNQAHGWGVALELGPCHMGLALVKQPVKPLNTRDADQSKKGAPLREHGVEQEKGAGRSNRPASCSKPWRCSWMRLFTDHRLQSQSHAQAQLSEAQAFPDFPDFVPDTASGSSCNSALLLQHK